MARQAVSSVKRAKVRGQFATDALLAEPWTGPVERFKDLSPERRVAIGLEPVERRRSEVLIKLCGNIYCRSWTPSRLKYCTICHT